MDPPQGPGAAGGTVKSLPGASRGLPGAHPARHLQRPPTAAAPAGAVAAAGSRSVLPLWRHKQSDAKGKAGGPGACRATCMQIACMVSCIVSCGKRSRGGRGWKGRQGVGEGQGTRGAQGAKAERGANGENGGATHIALHRARQEEGRGRRDTARTQGMTRASRETAKGASAPQIAMHRARKRERDSRQDMREQRGQTKGEEQGKGAREGTGTQGDAAQRVVHVARHVTPA